MIFFPIFLDFFLLVEFTLWKKKNSKKKSNLFWAIYLASLFFFRFTLQLFLAKKLFTMFFFWFIFVVSKVWRFKKNYLASLLLLFQVYTLKTKIFKNSKFFFPPLVLWFQKLSDFSNFSRIFLLVEFTLWKKKFKKKKIQFVLGQKEIHWIVVRTLEPEVPRRILSGPQNRAFHPGPTSKPTLTPPPKTPIPKTLLQ
jgi:hypothetical protein